MHEQLIHDIENADAGGWQLTNSVLIALGWEIVTPYIGSLQIRSPAGIRYPIEDAPAVTEDLTTARNLIPPDWDLEIEYTSELVTLQPDDPSDNAVRYEQGNRRAVCRIGDPLLGLDGEAVTIELAICAAILRVVEHLGGDYSAVLDPARSSSRPSRKPEEGT